MFTRVRISLAVSILVAGCATHPAAVAPESIQRTVGAVDGIDSTVFQYDEGLYRGGDVTTQQGMNELKKLGVKTVFSVTPTDDERAFAARSGLRLVEVPFTKEGIPESKLPFYIQQLRDAEQPLYVHCHSGKNRGGTLLAAYRIHVQKWDFEKARSEFVALGGRDQDFPKLMQSVRKD
jgi:protein tyrosine phosphatase (PTP) superfamily phosphohydrolase (DUF442 family)